MERDKDDPAFKLTSGGSGVGLSLPCMKSDSAYRLVVVAFAVLLGACRIEPEPIAYGSDACAHCRMTIVDPTHAAQLVTKKGKQFKFDAIECLVQKLPEWSPEEIGLLRVADYAAPGQMTDAKNATYLISKGIRSPMGANLSAFADPESAAKAQTEHTGRILKWNELANALESVFQGTD